MIGWAVLSFGLQGLIKSGIPVPFDNARESRRCCLYSFLLGGFCAIIVKIVCAAAALAPIRDALTLKVAGLASLFNIAVSVGGAKDRNNAVYGICPSLKE